MHVTFADTGRGAATPVPTFRLLGDFAVEPDGLAPHGRKARALLARLVLADGPLARDRLSALLWSRRADTQAHASLRQCLVELKPWTRASPPLVRADRDTVAIDRLHVSDDISLLRAACAAADIDAALRWLPAEDVGLLADLDGVDEAWDDWLTAERARQGETIVREVLSMADRLIESGDVVGALAVADRVTRFDPCSEHAARLVMRARWEAGDGDGVRHAWQRIEDALARGLDGKPAAETIALYRSLQVRQRPLSATVPAASMSGAAPELRRPILRWAPVGPAVLALMLAGADAPLGAPPATAYAAPVVRIEPVVSRGNGAVEAHFADALAGDFVRLANASGGVVRVLDGRTAGTGGDFVVRVAIEQSGGSLTSESRVVDALNGSILWSSRLSADADDIARLRERTAVSVAGIVDCALDLNGRNRALAADADRRTLVFAICGADHDENIEREVALLEQMVRRWPRDSAALGKLAMARSAYIFSEVSPAEQEVRRRDAISFARRALAVDPGNVAAIVALAATTSKGDLSMVAGLPMIDRALRINPDYSPALMFDATALFQAGFVSSSVDPAIRAAKADPTSIYKALAVVRRLAAAGRLDEASDRFAEIEAIWPAHPDLAEHRRRLAVERGRADAIATYRTIMPGEYDRLDAMMLHQMADPAAERRELDIAAEEEFMRFPPVGYQLAAHYARTGDMRKALNWLDRAPAQNTEGQWSLLFWPSVAPLRRDPRFFAKMAQIGLVDYWRRQDRWPDFCSEPGLRYNCRAEAARLAAAGRAVSGGSGASR